MSSFGYRIFDNLYVNGNVGNRKDLQKMNKALGLEVEVVGKRKGLILGKYTDPQLVQVFATHIKRELQKFSNVILDDSHGWTTAMYLFASSSAQTPTFAQVCEPVGLWPSPAHTIVRRYGHLQVLLWVHRYQRDLFSEATGLTTKITNHLEQIRGPVLMSNKDLEEITEVWPAFAEHGGQKWNKVVSELWHKFCTDDGAGDVRSIPDMAPCVCVSCLPTRFLYDRVHFLPLCRCPLRCLCTSRTFSNTGARGMDWDPFRHWLTNLSRNVRECI